MPDNERNIYRTSRRAAGLTQEAAAERLGISIESIRAYENGYRFPPTDIVELMVILYNAQHLAYQHLRETNALSRSIIPPVEERSLLEAAVRIWDRLEAAHQKDIGARLLRIAEDGVVDDTEREAYEGIIRDLRGIVASVMEVSCHG